MDRGRHRTARYKKLLAAALSFASIQAFWPTGAVPTASLANAAPKKTVVRVGYFPNITHSQALLGLSDGTFAKYLGKNVEIKATAFNAGPSVIEAMFAGEIDISYIGPNPAINGYIQSAGKALRVVAGATSGGASLVVRRDSGIKSAKDLDGKRVASPQLGNTQDVALRSYLADHGLKPIEKGGTVSVIPVANADQLTMFLRGDIDGAWAPEPWASRLVREAKGRILVDERTLWPKGKFTTALVIASTDFIKKHRSILKDWLKAHVSLTQRIQKKPAASMKAVNAELRKLTGKALGDEVLTDAFGRLEVTYDPLCATLHASARKAHEAGLLGSSMPNLTGIFDLSPLNEVLTELKLKRITE